VAWSGLLRFARSDGRSRAAGRSADFSLASSDFRALGAFFCNFLNRHLRPLPPRPSKRSPMSTKRSRGCERRRRNKDRPPSFLPRISKSKLFSSKLFQTILWRFCVISKGYKASKPHLAASKSFRRSRLHSAAFATPPDRIPPLRAVWARACAAVRWRLVGEGKGRRVHSGGVIRIERIVNLARSQIIRKEMSIFLPRDSATILSRAGVKCRGPTVRDRISGLGARAIERSQSGRTPNDRALFLPRNRHQSPS
jgi:hypothetical protein